MTNETPQVLTIAGIDSSGGAGISADLKSFAAQHVYGANVVVALTAQNTLGVQEVLMISPEMIHAQLQSIVDDLRISAVKSGMLGDVVTVEKVADFLKMNEFGTYILDPVMVAKGGAHLLNDKAIVAVKSVLLPLATLITPNIPEAEVLSGVTINDHQDMMKAALKIQKLGAKNVLLKGGHTSAKHVYDYILLADGHHFWMKSTRVDTKRTHGTGDTISAAITAQLALGKDMKTAIISAKAYVDATIRNGIQVGHGHGPLNHQAKVTEVNNPEVLANV
ncbi:hydroxymethylpyrimidine/phosphomethylpyrimidine kinase [Leuconostoc litchii]|uniref:Hydroxymethylpyrimidine/phosphomethylpyrimidine kinase n=1 Tax=Leuconostoc litchii TaxID=1981069 RepID=A0A6P2CPC3_9LACO|nr:bifunctional hydroxymethylpyrimidine kinase/phosphomethylpyrimidine kinase [Leuconostoc litchii]TYC47434.1 bifunctional hydroxymethylpyrimidine kinase/phosphomethylpyrimidine kinase [Leuconostoc litchii]GMA69451.1 hydroxymethylpyrimidine/phosphomethylpyrimidine kinase [Leuconostoc litchii]